jgi:hypothetical protein
VKAGGFLSRWQECVVWLPVLVILALFGWIVFGALDQRITSDALAWLLELPIQCAYFAAACAAAWMFKQTYLFDFQLNLAGDRNARWLLIKDRLEWFFLLGISLAFFWPAR